MNKQYLIIVDDGQKALLQALLGGNVQFLEVQGMDMQGNASCKVLVAPVAPPVNPMPVPDAITPPVEVVPL
jgi:hypothetical protein